MFNDLSTPLAYLASRRSGRPRDMVGPGPGSAELDSILALAMRTPDHGKLFPWRFVVVGSDQRDELAALLSRALDQNDPGAGAAHRQKADEFAHNGEALVVLLSAPVIPHKIPVWEQELSVGAAAMNLLHAIHAHGYVGSWLTGWATYDPVVEEAFRLAASERIAGFFFIGSPGRPLEERPRPDPQAVVRRWSPPL
ncbi:nitroreductase family protein [Sphingomonas glaciei]|uniref:Putative NAD(P)H nitroreductase n=1 Tax=Sphingomonas glaciei TaxID=2938948 RepID=A0ABY5MWP5_9SPHN|nr:nitroreductase [Sphingomonas glaciei]UUR08878.1 nitroreductase [Sphingomonas glaciei]